MRLIALLILATSLLFIGSTYAQPTPTWVEDTTVVGDPPPEPGSNTDILQRYEDVKRELDALKSADGGKMLIWFMVIAAVTNLLISVVKRFMKVTSRGKKYLPWVALGLGVVTGFFSQAALGVGILAALWYGAGPPTAVLIQELVGPIKSE